MRLPRLLPFSAAGAAALAAACLTSAHAQSLLTLYESARDYDATYQGARAQYDAKANFRRLRMPAPRVKLGEPI